MWRLAVLFIGGLALMTLSGYGKNNNDLCGAAALAPLVGQPIDEIRTALPTGRSLRFIDHGGIEHMDYRPGRLKIQLSNERKVTGFVCG